MLSGIVGGFVFIVFYFFLKAGFLFSALLGAAGTVAVWFLKGTSEEMEILIEGVSDEELKGLLVHIKAKTDVVQASLARINDKAVKTVVAEILKKSAQIVSKLKKDPRYVKISRRFFNYYLDALMTILGKYAELESHSDLGSDVVKSIEKVKGALMKISEAFRGHHRRLLEGDIMSLEAEIALLEKTASMEMNGE